MPLALFARPVGRLLALLALLLPPALAGADTPAPVLFPFVTPWDDASKTFLDVSFLNDGPAGSHGFITVKGGHFIEGDTGRRIKFLGTNLGLDGVIPAHEDAARLAPHLAKYGINVVRLHHQDATWAPSDYNLWDPKYKDHRHLDPEKLDRMDYLVAQLEKSGIYVDTCLHVSRKFSPADGFPESVKQLPLFDKRVDEFDPQMIQVDQEYFRDLMTHFNPYTHKTYAADPGLLNVEINNENSLIAYDGVPGSGLSALPEPYEGELRALWNGWLRRKYGTTARLAAVWKSPEATHGPNLYPWTPDPAQWTLEVQPGAQAMLTQDGDALRADVTQIDDTNWHVQLYRKGMSVVENGRTYTLTFEAKADRDRDQPIAANLQHPNYNNVGLNGAVHLTPQWQAFSITFTAGGAEAGQNRLPSLTLGGQTGTVWLRNVAVKEGIGAFALPTGQTLDAGTVAAEPSGQGVPRADWLAFLAATEGAYVAKMRAFLRDDLGVKQNVFCSQVGFGGLFGVYREGTSEYDDNHGYWDYHDTLDQPIFNRPMVTALGAGDALSSAALHRVAGKPYSITEYNHSFPNEYRAEAMPEYAGFAAHQDWDAIFLFSHGGYGARGAQFGQLDRMQFTLEASVDPAIWGFLPSAALMFRAGEAPAAPGGVTLALPAQFPATQVAKGLDTAGAWKAQGVTPADTFTRRIGLGIGLAKTARTGAAAPVPALRVSVSDPKTARFVLDAPTAKAITGYVGGQTVTLAGAKFAFGRLTNRFGALTLTALDRQPLARSTRVLLTFVTHTQNTGQTWNAARTLLTNQGTGPVLVDAAEAAVTLTADGPRTVYALNQTGAQGAKVPSTYANGTLTFSVTPGDDTIWYAIVKP